ncbi:programmed cell death protein 2-like [Nilaparvata lugens]|uniref:programmed cell death protein 2-like n=1 Tax=Nilaparvata lugens TaxID=108931 RepID=UPI00193D6850|nr:programmed cell death protein 2-like [Nilaparvata lugens]
MTGDIWVCLRSHVPCGTGGGGRGGGGGVEVAVNMSTDWCEGADNWEDEQNGNTIELLSNQVSSDDDHDKSTIELLSNQVSSDEDHDITAGLAELNVNQRNTNANRRGGGMSGAGGGAMGRLLSPTASAEIEGGDESEVVTIDTPPTAQVNVISLFEQAAPVPQVPSSSLYFSPYFISVGEEERCTSNSPTNAEHVRELMHGSSHAVDGGSGNGGGGIGGSGEVSCEKYERSLPAHGDKMFHTFLCRIQSNPGQLLRYCRDGGSPLFLYPPHDLPSRCRYCHGELAFELQLLPTIIPRLRLVTSSTGSVDPAEHLEFGSVFLFACRRSCWTLGDSFREEQLYVQVEKI